MRDQLLEQHLRPQVPKSIGAPRENESPASALGGPVPLLPASPHAREAPDVSEPFLSSLQHPW